MKHPNVIIYIAHIHVCNAIVYIFNKHLNLHLYSLVLEHKYKYIVEKSCKKWKLKYMEYEIMNHVWRCNYIFMRLSKLYCFMKIIIQPGMGGISAAQSSWIQFIWGKFNIGM